MDVFVCGPTCRRQHTAAICVFVASVAIFVLISTGRTLYLETPSQFQQSHAHKSEALEAGDYEELLLENEFLPDATDPLQFFTVAPQIEGSLQTEMSLTKTEKKYLEIPSQFQKSHAHESEVSLTKNQKQQLSIYNIEDMQLSTVEKMPTCVELQAEVRWTGPS
jgi:hypothetical protein